MRAIVFLATLVAGLIVTNAGHAADDQGINDYAKAHWSEKKSCVPFVRKFESVCGNNFTGDENDPKFDKDGKANLLKPYDLRANTNSCNSLPANQKPQIQKGELISVYLTQAFVKDFVEMSWPGKAATGEIAIVARVVELDAQNDYDFSAAGMGKGRLVYYSEGVREGQYLNFSQLPIYGPMPYKGKPLRMEFFILELDIKEGTEASGLLSAVASLGEKAYPPASPILRVLDQIGGGLLKANKNDLEFKYHTALLSPEGMITSLKAGVLEYGNYAFVKVPFPKKRYADGTAEDKVNHPWSGWWFNQKNGRLYEDETCSKPLLERTYFTLQINRGATETSLDPANTLANFMTKLTKEGNDSSTEKIALITSLQKLVESEKTYQDIKNQIDRAIESRFPNGAGARSVSLPKSTVVALQTSLANITQCMPTQKPPPTCTRIFTDLQVDVLLNGMANLTGSKDIFDRLTFDNAAAAAAPAANAANAANAAKTELDKLSNPDWYYDANRLIAFAKELRYPSGVNALSGSLPEKIVGALTKLVDDINLCMDTCERFTYPQVDVLLNGMANLTGRKDIFDRLTFGKAAAKDELGKLLKPDSYYDANKLLAFAKNLRFTQTDVDGKMLTPPNKIPKPTVDLLLKLANDIDTFVKSCTSSPCPPPPPFTESQVDALLAGMEALTKDIVSFKRLTFDLSKANQELQKLQ